MEFSTFSACDQAKGGDGGVRPLASHTDEQPECYIPTPETPANETTGPLRSCLVSNVQRQIRA